MAPRIAEPVQVLIYEDLQCPDCASFREMLDTRLIPRYGDRVNFQNRDFPLPKHTWSRKAAIAARYFDEVDAKLGKTFRTYLLSHIRQIPTDMFDAKLAQFASDHNADPEKSIAALTDGRLAAQVEAAYREGLSQGVSRTPTLLIGPTRFSETFSFEQVARVIDEQLGANE